MSPEGHPTSLVVSKLSLRWALMEGQMVQLKETTPKIGRGELRRFLSRIKFVDSPYQVTSFYFLAKNKILLKITSIYKAHTYPDTCLVIGGQL